MALHKTKAEWRDRERERERKTTSLGMLANDNNISNLIDSRIFKVSRRFLHRFRVWFNWKIVFSAFLPRPPSFRPMFADVIDILFTLRNSSIFLLSFLLHFISSINKWAMLIAFETEILLFINFILSLLLSTARPKINIAYINCEFISPDCHLTSKPIQRRWASERRERKIEKRVFNDKLRR